MTIESNFILLKAGFRVKISLFGKFQKVITGNAVGCIMIYWWAFYATSDIGFALSLWVC